jgi:hypothetical protein
VARNWVNRREKHLRNRTTTQPVHDVQTLATKGRVHSSSEI